MILSFYAFLHFCNLTVPCLQGLSGQQRTHKAAKGVAKVYGMQGRTYVAVTSPCLEAVGACGNAVGTCTDPVEKEEDIEDIDTRQDGDEHHGEAKSDNHASCNCVLLPVVSVDQPGI